MKKNSTTYTSLFLFLAILVFGYGCSSGESANKNNESSKETVAKSAMTMTMTGQNDAFVNHRDSVPSQQQYSGPLFTLSHDYPATFTPVVNPTWHQALKGQPISSANVFAYMDALKSHIAPNVKPFFTNNQQWSAAKFGWFHEPWVGLEREAILGTYQGNGNPAHMFKSLKEDESGYVLVLYDSVAAYTVGQIWGKTGQKVNLLNNATQFPEGSVIVKLAFSNINYPQWPVMQNALAFSVYDTVGTTENPKKGYQMRKVSFFQMDVIVKDSKTAPKTGWVYSTFVYDKGAQGGFWEKMVPLGAMWGNDPLVNSPITPPYPKLSETVINPKAPAYSTETLGWGGRLSGPNDGAVALQAVDVNTGKVYNNLALSSCMSCHLPAQDAFKSFLLPGPVPTGPLKVYTPGSPKWMLWFRDNAGSVPFDSGQVAMDYDMVMAFKSVPAFNQAKSAGKLAATRDNVTREDIARENITRDNVKAVQKFRRHNTRSRFWH